LQRGHRIKRHSRITDTKKPIKARIEIIENISFFWINKILTANNSQKENEKM